MNETLRIIAAAYLSIMNIAGFLTMGIDKRRAVRNRWRIPERTLFLIALLGGGIGSWLGMHYFRHKTKHMSFRIVLPLSAAITLFLIYYFISSL